MKRYTSSDIDFMISTMHLSPEEVGRILGRTKQSVTQMGHRLGLKRVRICECGEQFNKIGLNTMCADCSLKSLKYYRYSIGAKARGYIFTLSFLQFMKYWQEPCSYCSMSIETVGIDRIDNSKGYEEGNCVSCCSVCNRMKGTLSVDQFLKHIERIKEK